jgi:hypothetical protein
MMRERGLTAKSELHTRERLVRDLRQARHDEDLQCAKHWLPISTPLRVTTCSWRLAQRRPHVRLFPHAIGVANVRAFAGRLDHDPAYVTTAEAGAGFCEVVDALLARTLKTRCFTFRYRVAVLLRVPVVV